MVTNSNSRMSKSEQVYFDSGDTNLIVMILLNWNGMSIFYNKLPILKICLENLDNLIYSNLKIVVVDANSSDNSVSYINSIKDKSKHEIRVIKTENIGWAHNNNVGIKYVFTNFKNIKHIILISNDILIYDNRFLEQLNKIISNIKDFGFLGCKILGPDNKIQNSGLFVGLNTGLIGTYTSREEGYLKNNEYIVGAFLIISADALISVGLLDENYDMMGSEDVDIEERIRRKNYESYYTDKIEVMHIGSASTFNLKEDIKGRWDLKKLNYSFKRNHFVFLFRYYKHLVKHYFLYEFIRSFFGIKPYPHPKSLSEIKYNIKTLFNAYSNAKENYNRQVIR